MRLLRLHVILACSYAMIPLATGCKTSGTEDKSTVLLSAPTVRGQGWSATLELDQATSQDLYLKALKGELDTGAQAPKDQFHESRAVLMCQRNMDKTRCVVAPILKGWKLGPDQPLSEGISRDLTQSMTQVRPDLAPLTVFLGMVHCRYLGKSSPPFGVELAKCALSFPHTKDEIVFADQPAEVIAEALRSERSHGEGETVLRGTLFCQMTGEDRLSPCMARGHTVDGVKDRVTALTADDGPLVLQILRFSLFDLRPRATGNAPMAEGQKPNSKVPLEVKLEMECQLNSSQVALDGKRMVRCLGKI